MIQDTVRHFGAELNTFFIVALLSMAFGALAMGIGMMIVVQTVLAGRDLTSADLLIAVTGCAGIVFGLWWITTSSHILRGIRDLRREYRHRQEPTDEDTLTGWIVRMTAHYRENTRTIRWMNGICLAGGCIYLLFGLQNLYSGLFPVTGGSGAEGLISACAAAAINCTIGIAGVLLSLYFYRYSRVWDERIKKAQQSESLLSEEMERV